MVRWIERVVQRAGPFVAAAGSFADDRANGAEGIRELAARVEAHARDEHASERDDHAFVERAGAFLALLLIDHVGDAAHVAVGSTHRVRLGAHGVFDPFGAIEEALEAPRPRAALADAVARAEAEARGEGPVSRVVRALLAARPDLRIERQVDRVLYCADGIEIDLGRTIDATWSYPEGVPGAIARIAAAIPAPGSRPGSPGTSVAWEDARHRLLPRLVGSAFLGSFGERSEPALALTPVTGEIRCALVLAYDGRAKFVRTDELVAWGISPEDARSRAIENLAGKSAAARFVGDGPLLVARSGDGLDAARLLMPATHHLLAERLGSPFVAAVPHRDVLLASSVADAEGLAARARDDARRAPHPISATVVLIHHDGRGVSAG